MSCIIMEWRIMNKSKVKRTNFNSYDKCECCGKDDYSVVEKIIDNQQWLLCSNCRDAFIPHKKVVDKNKRADSKTFSAESIKFFRKRNKKKKKKSKKPKVKVDNFKKKKRDDKEVLNGDNYKLYINSADWKRIRKRTLRRAKDKCIVCGGKGNTVHHWKYPSHWGCERDVEVDVMCKHCHDFIHDELPDLLENIKKSKRSLLIEKKQDVIYTAYAMIYDEEMDNEYFNIVRKT